MNTYVMIYLIIATVWTVCILYSVIARKFLSQEDKDGLDLVQGSMSKRGWITLMIFEAVFEFATWPLTMIYYIIVAPLIKRYYKRHYNIPQD